MRASPDTFSPHIRYYGGAFGRLSLLSAGVMFANHARDCTQVLLNVDARRLPVVIDDRLHLLAARQAIFIHPRQTYAIPARKPAWPGAESRTGSILVKAPTLDNDAWRTVRCDNAVLTLPARSHADIADYIRELTRQAPNEGWVEAAAAGLLDIFRGLAPSAAKEAALFAAEWPHPLQHTLARDADSILFGELNVLNDLAALAQAYDVSERHFFTLFRRATGMTPRAFYNMRRLEMAFALLLEEDISLADVGYELGFSAPPHFTRFMRTNTGWTPSAYRHAVARTPPRLRPTLQHTVPFQLDRFARRRLP